MKTRRFDAVWCALAIATAIGCQGGTHNTEPEPAGGTCDPVAGDPGAEQACVWVPQAHECQLGGNGARCQIEGKMGDCGELTFDNDGAGLDGKAAPGGRVPDLAKFRRFIANFRGFQLRGAKINGLLAFADFEGADLDGADLSGADFPGASFRNATMRHVKFGYTAPGGAASALPFTDFRGTATNLRDANLRGTNLTAARFDGAHLEDARLDDIVADHSVWDGATAHAATFTGAKMAFASFVAAHLEGTDFSRANIRFSDLRAARGGASDDYAVPATWTNAILSYTILCGSTWGPPSSYLHTIFAGSWHQDAARRKEYWDRWGMAYADPERCSNFKSRSMAKLDPNGAIATVNTDLIRICADPTGAPFNPNHPCPTYAPDPDLKKLLDSGMLVPLRPRGGTDHGAFDADLYGLIVGDRVIGYQKVLVVRKREFAMDRDRFYDQVQYKGFNPSFAGHYAPVRRVPTTVHPKQLELEDAGVWEALDVAGTFILHCVPGGGTAYMLAFENPNGEIWNKKKWQFAATVAMDIAAFASMGSNAAAASANGILKREAVGIAANQSIAVGQIPQILRRLTWSNRLRVGETIFLGAGVAFTIPQLAHDAIQQQWLAASGDMGSMLLGMYFIRGNVRAMLNIRSARSAVNELRGPSTAKDWRPSDTNVALTIPGYDAVSATWTNTSEQLFNQGVRARQVLDAIAPERLRVQSEFYDQLVGLGADADTLRKNFPAGFGELALDRLLHPIESTLAQAGNTTRHQLARMGLDMLDQKAADMIPRWYRKANGGDVPASRILRGKREAILKDNLMNWHPDWENQQFVLVSSPRKTQMGEILDDAMFRIDRLVAGQVQGIDNQLVEFANATYGYYHGLPFSRGGDGIGRVVLAGAFKKVFGVRPHWVDGTDIRAMMMCQEDFVAWFLKNIAVHP